MDSKIRRIYVPMTESGFYILFCLQQPQYGYGISQQVRRMTGGELIISAGTMYGTLSKMEKDGLIVFEREEEKRKLIPAAHEPDRSVVFMITREDTLIGVLSLDGQLHPPQLPAS